MSTHSYEICLVNNAYLLDRWEEVSAVLKTAFSDSLFSDGFYPDRPVEHTWSAITGDAGVDFQHVIALNREDKVLGACLCVPVKRPPGVKNCDIGWFFVTTNISGLQRIKVADAVVSRVKAELIESGYDAIITEMGTDSGAEYLSKRLGFVPAPTEAKRNRWILNLKTASETEINLKSVRRTWSGSGNQEARYAITDLKVDEIIIDLKPIMKRVKKPSASTLQLAEAYHYKPSIVLALNHSCEPSGYFCFDDFTYRARHDIKAGEELTFHYCSTEYELAEPFLCQCGSANCLGQIRGFKFLDEDEKQGIAMLLSPFLREKFEMRP